MTDTKSLRPRWPEPTASRSDDGDGAGREAAEAEDDASLGRRAEVPADGPQRPEQKPSSEPERPLQQKQVNEVTFSVPCRKARR